MSTNILKILSWRPSFRQSFFDNITQVFSLSATSEAVDDAAEGGHTPMGVVALHPLHPFGLKVSCAYEKVGKGLTVVVLVVVEQKLWRVSQRLCFCNYLFPGVESTQHSWDLVTKKN